MKPLLCIYHGNCADGFGSACVVRRFCAEHEIEVEFYAGVYQRDPPDVSDRHVLFVDFSYKREVLMKMLAQDPISILVLDHHKTAMEDLIGFKEPLPLEQLIDAWKREAHYDIRVLFDMERSGAGLSWDFFFPNHKRPMLINAIEDRDLWRLKLPYTREIQAALFSYPYDFELWEEIIERTSMPLGLNNFIDEGIAIERKHFKDIDELLQIVTRPMKFFVPAGASSESLTGVDMVVPVANLPYTMVSDAGHALCERDFKGRPRPRDTANSDINPLKYFHPFAVCYYDGSDGRNFSLRSREYGADVGAIAKFYGGGGHAHAAGFRVPFDKLAQFEP